MRTAETTGRGRTESGGGCRGRGGGPAANQPQLRDLQLHIRVERETGFRHHTVTVTNIPTAGRSATWRRTIYPGEHVERKLVIPAFNTLHIRESVSDNGKQGGERVAGLVSGVVFRTDSPSVQPQGNHAQPISYHPPHHGLFEKQ